MLKVELSGTIIPKVLLKRSRFTETQIVAVLMKADAGIPVKKIWRKHGISKATYYNCLLVREAYAWL